MPRRLPVVLLAIAILACGKKPTRLEGHWRGMKAEGVGGEVQGAANAFAANMELDVKGDRITVTTPRESQSGTFKVLKDDASTMVIATDKAGEEKETFTFVDDKTMKWAALEGKTIVFERQPGPK
jgi:hypothetical protein